MYSMCMCVHMIYDTYICVYGICVYAALYSLMWFDVVRLVWCSHDVMWLCY